MGDQRSERIQGGRGRLLQVRAAVPSAFTEAKRRIFLDTLAATCNVTTASRAAGVDQTTASRWRRTSPAFADLWGEALEIGYAHLEERLLACAVEGLNAMAIDPDDAPVPPLPSLADAIDRDVALHDASTPDPAATKGLALAAGGAGVMSGRSLPVAYQLALLVLNQRRAARANGPRTLRRKAMTTQEVDALLVRKLDRLERLEAKRSGPAPAADAPEPTDDNSSPGVGA